LMGAVARDRALHLAGSSSTLNNCLLILTHQKSINRIRGGNHSRGRRLTCDWSVRRKQGGGVRGTQPNLKKHCFSMLGQLQLAHEMPHERIKSGTHSTALYIYREGCWN